MSMHPRLAKLGRLFVIKTRFEAWAVTYAIAVGAIERGRHYLQLYPGWEGWMLAVVCTGVVFIAGAKLLDSVKSPAPAIAAGPYPAAQRGPTHRSRPRLRPTRSFSESRISRHTD